MERKMMTRYLILIVILIICAGAAWYFTNRPSEPVDNAVLACADRTIGIVVDRSEGSELL